MTDTQETLQPTRTDHATPQFLLDHVIATCKKPTDLIGENGWRKQSTKAMVDVASNAEMAEHRGHDRLGAFDRLHVISYIQAP